MVTSFVQSTSLQDLRGDLVGLDLHKGAGDRIAFGILVPLGHFLKTVLKLNIAMMKPNLLH